MTVNFSMETECEFDFDAEKLGEEIVCAVLDRFGFPYEACVDITITDDEGIREINLENRQIDAPTDVLSFPMIEYDAPADFDGIEKQVAVFDPDSGEAMLGDIVLNIDRIRSQAAEYGHSIKREYSFLITHSMLHLLGFDHMEEDEREQMEGEQRKILDKLGIKR